MSPYDKQNNVTNAQTDKTLYQNSLRPSTGGSVSVGGRESRIMNTQLATAASSPYCPVTRSSVESRITTATSNRGGGSWANDSHRDRRSQATAAVNRDYSSCFLTEVSEEVDAAGTNPASYEDLMSEVATSFQSLNISDSDQHHRLNSHFNANQSCRRGRESEASTRPSTGQGGRRFSQQLSQSIDHMSIISGSSGILRSQNNKWRPSSSSSSSESDGLNNASGFAAQSGYLAQYARHGLNECCTATDTEAAVEEGTSSSLLSSAPDWQAQFYKTKLCPFYVADFATLESTKKYGANIGWAKGSCMNGANCRFAHSFSELRPLPDLRKTKLCSSYTKKVVCKTPNCPFAHSPQELRTSSSVFYKVTLCNFYKNQKCWNGPNCRFAHGNEELRIPPAGLTSGNSSPSVIPPTPIQNSSVQPHTSNRDIGLLSSPPTRGVPGRGGTAPAAQRRGHRQRDPDLRKYVAVARHAERTENRNEIRTEQCENGTEQRESLKADRNERCGNVSDDESSAEKFLEEIVNRFDESTTRLLLTALMTKDNNNNTSDVQSGDNQRLEDDISSPLVGMQRGLLSSSSKTLSLESIQSGSDGAGSDYATRNDFGRNDFGRVQRSESQHDYCEENGENNSQMILKYLMSDLVVAAASSAMEGPHVK